MKCSVLKVPGCVKYMRWDFAVCAPTCFSGNSDPQSSARRKTRHTLLRRGVEGVYKTKFCADAATDIAASGSKFKAPFGAGAVRLHTARNSVHVVRDKQKAKSCALECTLNFLRVVLQLLPEASHISSSWFTHSLTSCVSQFSGCFL